MRRAGPGDGAVAVVGLQTSGEGAAFHIQLPDPGREGQAQQLGHLDGHLAGVGVERVEPGQHQVERPLAPDGRGQRHRGGQGVAAGEGRITEMNAPVGAAGDHLPQGVGGRGRPHGEHHDLTAGAGQLHRLGVGPAAVGVDLQRHAVPNQAAFVHPELDGGRDLLDQNRDSHGALYTVPRHRFGSRAAWVPAPVRCAHRPLRPGFPLLFAALTGHSGLRALGGLASSASGQ